MQLQNVCLMLYMGSSHIVLSAPSSVRSDSVLICSLKSYHLLFGVCAEFPIWSGMAGPSLPWAKVFTTVMQDLMIQITQLLTLIAKVTSTLLHLFLQILYRICCGLAASKPSLALKTWLLKPGF